MNHPWPPNDPEREDWDRREAAHRHRIAELESELCEAKADLLVAREAFNTRSTQVAEAEIQRDEALERQQELLKVVEFYAGDWKHPAIQADRGSKARAIL